MKTRILGSTILILNGVSYSTIPTSCPESCDQIVLIGLSEEMALGMAVPVGNVFGITLNASLTERFGHKKILIGALVILSGLITIQFRATSIEQLFIGQILCGVPWGAFTTMA